MNILKSLLNLMQAYSYSVCLMVNNFMLCYVIKKYSVFGTCLLFSTLCPSSLGITLMWKRDLVALLYLSA